MGHREVTRRSSSATASDSAAAKSLHDPLAHRLLAAILAVSIALATIATLIEFGIDYRNEAEQLRSDLDAVRRNAAPRLSRALRAGDAIRIEQELNALLELSPVFHAQLVASDGRYFEAGRPVQPLRDRLQRTDKLEFVTAGGERQLLGSLHLEASTSALKSRLFDRLLLRVVLQSLKLVLVAAFILYFVRWLITRHLAVIAQQMRRTTSLNLREPLRLDRPWQDDEIGDLAQAFNLMRRNVLHEIEIRERHDRAVAADSQLNQLALDSLPQAALRISPEGVLAWMNGEAERLVGVPLAGAQGRSLAELLPAVRGGGERSPEVLFLQARAAPRPLSARLQLLGSSGVRDMDALAAAIRDGQGQVLGVLMLLGGAGDRPDAG